MKKFLAAVCLSGVVVTAVAFRFDQWHLGLVLASSTLLCAIICGVLQTRMVAGLTLLTTIIAATRLMPDAVWPCPISCQGGALYQELLGVPVSVWAVASLLVVSVVALRLASDADMDRRTVRSYLVSFLLWMFAGGSLFFLWIAWRLDMRCGYCVAVHTGVLAAACVVLRQTWWNAPAVILGFGVLLMAYGPTLRIDAPVGNEMTATQSLDTSWPDDECPCFDKTDVGSTPDPGTTDPGVGSFFTQPQTPSSAATIDPAVLRSIDLVRRIGTDKAPVVVEVVIDLYCPHCATALTPLMLALKPLAAAGRIEIVERFMIRRSHPHGVDLASHVLAAGSSNRFQLMVSLLVGSKEDTSWAAARSRVSEIVDPVLIETAYAANRQAIRALLESDSARLDKIQARQTPFVLLSKRSGEVLQRWSGEQVDPAAIAAAIP